MFNCFRHQMKNSLIQCHQCHNHEKHNFDFFFKTNVCTWQAIISTRTCISKTFSWACTKNQLKNFVGSCIFIILIEADRTILI